MRSLPLLQRNFTCHLTRCKILLGLVIGLPLGLFSQNSDSTSCAVLDSIFSHLGDLFPDEEEHRRHAIRLYELSGKDNFKTCDGYDYDRWNVYYYNALTFDINSGASIDFVILEDTLSGIQRTIRFFYAQAFCEHNIRSKMTGYIILEHHDSGLKIQRVTSFYLD